MLAAILLSLGAGLSAMVLAFVVISLMLYPLALGELGMSLGFFIPLPVGVWIVVLAFRNLRP